MEPNQLVNYLEDPSDGNRWLESLGVENSARGYGNIVAIANSGVTLDLLVLICQQLENQLVRLSDPGMALNNLDRFFAASRSPLSLASLFDRDPEALRTLMQIFSTSQYLSDYLILDPESFDLLRLTEGQPVAREVLVDEICTECELLASEATVKMALRRYKRRETLRIAYGDIIGQQQIGTVTRQISYVADAICEAALRFAIKTLKVDRGSPLRPDGQPARIVALALGKLGGTELNYSSDIDLVFVSDEDGKTDGRRPVTNQEFFERVVAKFVSLLTNPTELGHAYRVDLRLRPDGDQGRPVISAANALRYYDVKGRTWERQAYVKARPIAGDIELGEEFLGQLEPWIYRRYLSRADITGIKALKRRIERRAQVEGADDRDVKTGRGGIRDIEFVIQFLQLLNGGDLAQIRSGNTLEAIERLEQAGCLTWQERSLLEEHYGFLRKLEHRLQIMFDLQTHQLAESDREVRRVAIRMGFEDTPDQSALAAFRKELTDKTELNRKILDHLLHDAFADEGASEPETDLVLDPRPSQTAVDDVLGVYGFVDKRNAYDNLQSLSQEKISFLSTRRCRHFLASIAKRLLQAISATPDPDTTLVNLCKVSDSLGGKGVLWELFSANRSCLKLYVELCATSSYLAGILTSNPGMIDELMDSLIRSRLPSFESLAATLDELCRGAEDLEPILHSFKNAAHLRVGVRDILGKTDIRDAHRTLADVAEVCLGAIVDRELEQLMDRYGTPTVAGGRHEGGPCSLIILALGKLGGREPNYHSDLDVVFLFESEGATRHANPTPRDTTSNQHFFSQLAQRIIKVVTHLGRHGRLFELDPRLRPSGKSGALAISVAEFEKYFVSGQGQLWERQALCKARPVYGSEDARQQVLEVAHRCITSPPWQPQFAQDIRSMRQRLEKTASPLNLKRGPGGTVDIEFAVQMMQLRAANELPEILVPGTLDAIAALNRTGCLGDSDRDFFSESYRFLRGVESSLRLMNTTARHDLPEDEASLTRLAYLLDIESGGELLKQCQHFTSENRLRFDRIFEEASL